MSITISRTNKQTFENTNNCQKRSSESLLQSVFTFQERCLCWQWNLNILCSGQCDDTCTWLVAWPGLVQVASATMWANLFVTAEYILYCQPVRSSRFKTLELDRHLDDRPSFSEFWWTPTDRIDDHLKSRSLALANTLCDCCVGQFWPNDPGNDILQTL